MRHPIATTPGAFSDRTCRKHTRSPIQLRRIDHTESADLPLGHGESTVSCEDCAVTRSYEPRFLTARVYEALQDTRVVGVVGPRQAGKSTLVQHIVRERTDATYVSLDDRDSRIAAHADPEGFIAGRPGLLAIDEVQRVPELLLSIKASVDRDQRPGRFLITGSSQISANRDVSETLAGRIERLTLWPFSQGERTGDDACFLDRLFGGTLGTVFNSGDTTKRDYLDRALAGGYPEAMARSGRRRDAWFASYVQTVVEREAPGIAASPRAAELPRLLRLVAARHAGLLNVQGIADDGQMARTSVNRYLDVLEAVFLTARLPAWTPSLSSRESSTPKIIVTDPGLAASLNHLHADELAVPEVARGRDGPVIEGFVATELMRIRDSSVIPAEMSHYRDRRGNEVDLIIESEGRIAAIEVKAGASVDQKAVRTLAALRDSLGARFVQGIVMHTGPTGQVIGDRLLSMPISALWST